MPDFLKWIQYIRELFLFEKGEARSKRQADWAEKVIYDFFDNESYPKRRRSFREIRKSVQIYNDAPEKLQILLTEIGAVPVTGDGEDAYWHLPPPSTAQKSIRGNGRFQWSWVVISTLIVLSTIAIWQINDLSKILFSQTRAECLADLDPDFATFEDINKCNSLNP